MREHIYYLLAKFGLDTAENEPCQVCPIEQGGGRRRPGRRREPARAVGFLRTIADDSCTTKERANFTGLALGCMEAKFCKKICV